MIWNLFRKKKAQAEDKPVPLQAYFNEIATLSADPDADFFVTAVAENSEHFLQVGVSKTPEGFRNYEFDIPIVEWSRDYIEPLNAEAERRNAHIRNVDGGEMQFLDISFYRIEAHEDFVRWIIENLYTLPENSLYNVSSGLWN